MNRPLTYIGQSVYEWLFTKPAQDAMVAQAKLAAAIFGTNTLVNGLACTPTSPASLSVNIAAGEIYQLESLEATTAGTLPADTTRQILKQGVSLDVQSVAMTAPSTTGYSINYLIQVQYQDQDVSVDPTTGNTNQVLQFYDSSNPSQPYSGPNNSGASSNTFRNGIVAVQAKAGIAAATGSQTTPAADSGWVGLFVVTVANGQTQINSGNIVQVSGAPFLTETLLQKISQATADARYAQLTQIPQQMQSISASVASGALTLGLNPTTLAFRNATLNSGVPSTVTIGAALSLVVPSGATLGTVNGVAARLVMLALDNAGTAELAVVNLAGGNNLDETTLISTTAISAGATAANVIYSATARSNVPFRVVGFVDIPVVTAGTWVAPTTVQGAGGQAFDNIIQPGNSLSANGYQKLPGGLILQWASSSLDQNQAAVITLPVAWPNGLLGGWANKTGAYISGVTDAALLVRANPTNPLTQINVEIGSNGGGSSHALPLFVFALGH